ncbi:unnamed protein product [Sphenostylis stenocarpa]|uniref:Uncharacterized protein n=1 Tax=Sphenostylis stenocarpa TaxID=92480 RepID=A0AA86VFZ5_9FABA|nr:unnamed protein product [Sphenostylis stenocarpa]
MAMFKSYPGNIQEMHTTTKIQSKIKCMDSLSYLKSNAMAVTPTSSLFSQLPKKNNSSSSSSSSSSSHHVGL